MPPEEKTIPEGWTLAPVSQLIHRHLCGPSPDCEERPIASGEEWGVLKTTAITWAGWDENAHKVLPRSYWGRQDLAVERGDVLVTKAGPRDRVAVVAEVTTDPKKLIVSGKMIGLRPRIDEVLPKILASALTLPEPQKYIQARTTGMAESQVNFANGVLLDTKIPLPKLAEQSRIAAVLDMLDRAIAQTEAVIAKLKHVHLGLSHDLLTRGVDEQGQLRSFTQCPISFKDSSVGRIPRDWEVLTLEEITPAEAPICYGIVQAFDFVPDGVPVLTIQDLLGDYSTGLHRTSPTIDAQYARSRVQHGDVLVSVKGTIGRVGIVPNYYIGNISRDLARIRPIKRVLSGFLGHVLRSLDGQRTLEAARVGTTRAEISIAPLKKLKFAFPISAREQEAITALLDRVNGAIEAHTRGLTKTLHLKWGLRNDLLSGSVRVPETITTPAGAFA